LIGYLQNLGFNSVKLIEQFDCFRNTSMERTARRYGVHGANSFAGKP